MTLALVAVVKNTKNAAEEYRPSLTQPGIKTGHSIH